jgi:hypothetical protein
MAVTRWRLYDPFTTDEFVFPRNPEEDGEPSDELPFTTQPTTAADGTSYFFAGVPKARERTWTFKILSKSERDAWRAWIGVSKPYQVKLTTDLGDEVWIIIDKWTPKRKRTAKHELREDVTVHAFEVPPP